MRYRPARGCWWTTWHAPVCLLAAETCSRSEQRQLAQPWGTPKKCLLQALMGALKVPFPTSIAFVARMQHFELI